MMPYKQVLFRSDARERVLRGATTLTDAVRVMLGPRLTVGPGVDRARVMRVLERTGRACLVSASLSTPIRLEPGIVGA
jgi:hypothetical protein